MANWQFEASGVAAPGACQHLRGTEYGMTFEEFTGARLTLRLGRYCRLDLTPRQSGRRHRQGVVQIEHGTNTAAKKVWR